MVANDVADCLTQVKVQLTIKQVIFEINGSNPELGVRGLTVIGQQADNVFGLLASKEMGDTGC